MNWVVLKRIAPTANMTKNDVPKLPPADQPDVDDRVVAGQFPWDEGEERHAGHRRCTDDEVGVEPVILLPLVEHDLEEAKPHRDQKETDPIDLKPVPPQCFALPDQGWRLIDEGGHERERDRADRDIDEENPMPGRIVGDIAADRRPQRRRDNDRDPVGGESL